MLDFFSSVCFQDSAKNAKCVLPQTATSSHWPNDTTQAQYLSLWTAQEEMQRTLKQAIGSLVKNKSSQVLSEK